MFDKNTRWFIWGAGTYGKRLVEFMKNELTFEAFIDNNVNKQAGTFEGIPVISYEQAKPELRKVKIVIAQVYPNVVRDFLAGEGFYEYEDYVSIYDFIPRWYLANGNRVTPKVVNFVTSNFCTLSCQGCQSFIHKLKHPKLTSSDEMIVDADLLFKNIDSIYLINVCCGESLVNKSLSVFVHHVWKNYRNRYGSLVILTNGTIIPDNSELKVFSECEAVLSISDYSESNPDIKTSQDRLINKCEEYGVKYYLNTSSDKSAWFDFGDPDVITEQSPEGLAQRYKECFKPGCGIRDGILYTCQTQNAAIAVAEVPGPEPGDCYDLRRPKTDESRKELLRIIMREPKNGYISHCARCNGTTPIYSGEK